MKSNLYFKHDIYAIENDNELRFICSEYPVWGEAVFFKAITVMYRNNGQPINRNILLMDVSHGLFTDNKDRIGEIIDLCLEMDLFKKTEDGKIYSSRVVNECQSQAEFRKKQSEKGKIAMQKRWGKTDSDNEKITEIKPSNNQCYNSGLTTDITNKQEQEQDKERNIPIINDCDIEKESPSSGGLFDKKKDFSDTEQSSNPSSLGKNKDDTPYSEIVQYWNERAAKNSLSQCTKITDQRKRYINCRWNEYGNKVYEAIDKVMASDFCKSGNWCGFDWVFKPSNMVKVLEGNYDNKNGYSQGKKPFNPTDLNGRYSEYKAKKVQI